MTGASDLRVAEPGRIVRLPAVLALDARVTSAHPGVTESEVVPTRSR